jgi:hypothetical protein
MINNKSNVIIEHGLPTLYRCTDTSSSEGVYIEYMEYWAYKKTPQGYWVVPAECRNREYLLNFTDVLNRNKRYVSTTAVSPWCHLKKEDALNNFMWLKKKQIKYVQLKLATLQQIIDCNDPVNVDGRLFCGKPDEFYNWEWN